MNYLIDTHTFLWLTSGDRQLSSRAENLVEDIDNNIYISIASLWEMAIKISIKKLVLSEDFETLIPQELYRFDIHIFPIGIDHLVKVLPCPCTIGIRLIGLSFLKAWLKAFPLLGKIKNLEPIISGKFGK
jgi:PIN domain nuclease of toxin-antitoxin system